MDKDIYEAAVATLTKELGEATDEREKERLTEALDQLKRKYENPDAQI